MSMLPFTTHRILEQESLPALGECLITLTKEKRIIPPPDGWKAHTLYLVHVSFRGSNPIHEAFCMVGFVDKDRNPAGYSEIYSNSYDQVYPFSYLRYIRAIRPLYTKGE